MRVIGRTKPKGAMKVKGGCPGFGRWRPPGPIPDRPMPPGLPYQSEVIPKEVRGVSSSPPLSTSGFVGCPVRSVVRACSLVRRGAQARDLP